MTARFIISFDCEGKWGIADEGSLYHQPYFTNKNLLAVYEKLIALLDQYAMKATFAFVTAFTFSKEQYHECRHEFKEVLIDGKPWLAEFNKEINAGNYEGWLVPECFNLVKATKVHELASHGFTHLPLDEHSISLEDFQHEMNMIKKYAPCQGRTDLTLVYPRNRIGYTAHLPGYGFIGYRALLKTPQPTRVFSLVRELNIFAHADRWGVNSMPIPIPPGRFLNWRNGVRKKIPIKLTLQRWQHMLNDAIKNKGILHLWSHPHNFINGDNMFILFEEILKIVSAAQKRGEINNITQQEYCYDVISVV